MSKTVYLSSSTMNGGRVYHLSSNCKALQHPSVSEIQEKDYEVVEPQIGVCQVCAGVKKNNGSGNNEIYKAAVNHGNND